MQADTQARPVGQAPGRIDKRPGDDRAYLIDCEAVLQLHELITRVVDAQAEDGFVLRSARSRRGRLIEVHLAGGSVPAGKPYVDLPLRLQLCTTRGALEVLVVVRIHAF